MTITELGSDFYLPPSRLAFLNKIQVLVKQNKIVAIEGPTGIGKTAVLEEALTSELPDANKCYISASRSINDIQVRSRIIEQLFGNVLFDPEKPLISSFLEFNQQTQLLIAIDNGHFLSGKIVGELLQLFSELKKAGINLVVLLAFDKSLNNTLSNLQSNLVAIEAVPTLSKQESYQFLIEYFDDVPAQTSGRVKRWIESSGGRPIQLLAFNQDTSLKLSDGNGLNIKLWAGVVVIVSILLAVALYFYRLDLAEKDPQSAKTLTDVEAMKQETVKQWQASQAEAEKTKEEPPTLAQEVASPEEIFDLISQKQTVDTDSSKPEEEPVESTGLFDEANLASNDVVEVNELPKEAVIEEQALPSTTTEKLAAQTSASKVTEAVTEPEITNPIKQQPVSEGIVSTESEQYPSSQQETFYIIDNQTFFSLPSDQYVLQLTAVSTEATLVKYVLSAPVSVDQMRIYKIKRNEKDWIVVTYGLFASIADAREEAKRLNSNAWAKSVSVIQQQIRNFEQTQSR